MPWEKDVGIRKDGKPDTSSTKYFRPGKDLIEETPAAAAKQ